MNTTAEQPRICLTCTYCTHEVRNGADVVACTHQPDGAPVPLHPHAQRNQVANADANVCGEVGIFWKAKE